MYQNEDESLELHSSLRVLSWWECWHTSSNIPYSCLSYWSHEVVTIMWWCTLKFYNLQFFPQNKAHEQLASGTVPWFSFLTMNFHISVLVWILLEQFLHPNSHVHHLSTNYWRLFKGYISSTHLRYKVSISFIDNDCWTKAWISWRNHQNRFELLHSGKSVLISMCDLDRNSR